MDVERLSNELNDILIEFHNTLCNPSICCKDCEINKYRKKYSVSGSCNAIYLAIKLLGATEDTAIFINKQHIAFRATVCTDKGFNYCLNEYSYYLSIFMISISTTNTNIQNVIFHKSIVYKKR